MERVTDGVAASFSRSVPPPHGGGPAGKGLDGAPENGGLPPRFLERKRGVPRGDPNTHIPASARPFVAEVSPRLRALLVGEDPMIRYLVRESLATQGVHAAAEVAHPREFPAQVRAEHSSEVVVLCLSGPPEVWRNTISETRRTLPGGRLVAVTFGHDGPHTEASLTDGRLGADALVRSPTDPKALREAVLRAKIAKPRPPAPPSGPSGLYPADDLARA